MVSLLILRFARRRFAGGECGSRFLQAWLKKIGFISFCSVKRGAIREGARHAFTVAIKPPPQTPRRRARARKPPASTPNKNSTKKQPSATTPPTRRGHKLVDKKTKKKMSIA